MTLMSADSSGSRRLTDEQREGLFREFRQWRDKQGAIASARCGRLMKSVRKECPSSQYMAVAHQCAILFP